MGRVTFQSSSKTASEIKTQLAKHNVNVTASGGSGSLVSFQSRGLDSVVRASLHYYNSEQEIVAFIAILGEILDG